MEITPATPTDARRVAQCVAAAYGHYVARIGMVPGPMREDYERTLAEHSVWVVRDGERVVGLLVLIDKPERLLLDNVAVHPDYQGRGIGRKLLKFAEAEAAHRGYHTIYLYTHEKMHKNIALYTRMGYVEFERRTVMGLKRVYMEKRLNDNY